MSQTSSPSPHSSPKSSTTQEHDEIIHEYDGIGETDNPLPRWWLLTFYGAIVFSVIYFFHYQVFHSGPNLQEELQASMAGDVQRQLEEAKRLGAINDQVLLTMAKDPTSVAAGHATFTQLCVSCHGEHAEGKIGPNLTDAYWLHGGKPKQIFETVTNGVPDKGMPTWGKVIGTDKVEQVVSFLLTIRDTNVPGKPPQGEKE